MGWKSEEAGSSFFILLTINKPFSAENIEVKGYSMQNSMVLIQKTKLHCAAP
jgi:hypothetical protein